MMFTERISEDANQAWKCSERRKIPDELSLKQSVSQTLLSPLLWLFIRKVVCPGPMLQWMRNQLPYRQEIDVDKVLLPLG